MNLCKLEVTRIASRFPLGSGAYYAAQRHHTETGRADWLGEVEGHASHQAEIDLLVSWANAVRVIQREFQAYAISAPGVADDVQRIVDGLNDVIGDVQGVASEIELHYVEGGQDV